MSRRHPPLRPTQFLHEHERSTLGRGDRIRNRPLSLAQLHRWLTEGYSLEAPARLHDRDIADDGAPDHTPEAKRYLGLSQGISDEDGQVMDPPVVPKATDWVQVARRRDRDGFYLTPMRAAISMIADPDARALLGGLACNLLTPLDVTRAHGIPDWCAGRVMYSVLDDLWRAYTDRPLPQRTGRSDAQLDAEAAA